MSTTITATLLRNLGVTSVRERCVELSLSLPTSWTEAGVALDLSAAANGGFTYVTKAEFMGVAITDYGVIWKLIGTAGSGIHAGGLLASSVKVIGIEAAAKTGNAEAATMPNGIVADNENHSAKACHLKVWGY